MFGSRSVAIAAALVALVGCSSNDEPQAAPTSSSLTSATATPETNGRYTIGSDDFAFVGTCYLPGDNNITITGAGVDPQTNAPIDLRLQNIPARPHVGIRTSGRLIESSLDGELSFTVDAGIVRADNIEFVEDLDLLSGVGQPIGSGSIEVRCDSYIEGAPG